MLDGSNTLGAPAGLDASSSAMVVLSTDEWFALQAAMETAYYYYPTDKVEMKKHLDMKEGDSWHAEFDDTISLFARFEDISELFLFTVMPMTRKQAQDILHYNRLVQPILARLIRTMDAIDFNEPANPEDAAALAKEFGVNPEFQGPKARMVRYIDRLIREADERVASSDMLLGHYNAILTAIAGGANGEKGLARDFEKQDVDLDDEGNSLDDKIAVLKAKKQEIVDDLEDLRTKQGHEERALYAMPAYFFIPFVGPFVAVGVAAGVGADLARTNAKIDALMELSAKIASEIGALKTQRMDFTVCSGLVTDAIGQLETAKGHVEKLSKGWGNLKGALSSVQKFLSGNQDAAREMAAAGDFMFSGLALESAALSWADAARYAEAQTLHQPVVQLKSAADRAAYQKQEAARIEQATAVRKAKEDEEAQAVTMATIERLRVQGLL